MTTWASQIPSGRRYGGRPGLPQCTLPREAAQKESGDVIAAGKAFAELGEVVSGTRPGRQSDEEVTLFKSLGLAVEDVATAELVYRKALGRA